MSRWKNRGLCLCACGVLSLASAPTASADFVGLVIVNNDDPDTVALCNSAGGAEVSGPLAVCTVYAVFDEPDDQLLSAAFTDVTTTDPDGFFQHPSGTDVPHDCDLLTESPDLICDSYVTIGNVCDAAGADRTTPDGDFVSVDFNQNGHLVGGWWSPSYVVQGRAGTWPDLAVRVAQLSVNAGHSTSGTLSLFWLHLGNPMVFEEEVLLECTGAVECQADFDDSGNVGAADLAVLLASWGPCKGCPADLNGDGQVGPFDLATLLGTWGECG